MPGRDLLWPKDKWTFDVQGIAQTLGHMGSYRKLLMFLGLCALAGCASKYHAVDPETLAYVYRNGRDRVTLEYKYDVLKEKYRQKEDRHRIRLVALKITNHSGTDFIFGEDAVLAYTNGEPLEFLDTPSVYRSLKQASASYLLGLLLTPLSLFASDTRGSQGPSHAAWAVGPGWAAGNMMGAQRANKNFREELMVYDLFGTVVPAGETRFGLVGLRSTTYNALYLKQKEPIGAELIVESRP